MKYKVTAESAFQPSMEFVTESYEEAMHQKWEWRESQFLVKVETIDENK